MKSQFPKPSETVDSLSKKQSESEESQNVLLMISAYQRAKSMLSEAQDILTRVTPILEKLASMGITEADLMGDVVELRLRGAKIVEQVASRYTADERRALRATQQALGTMSIEAVAVRLNMPVAELGKLMDRFRDDLAQEFAYRFQRGITLDELDISDVENAILSFTPDVQPTTPQRSPVQRQLQMVLGDN